MNLAHPHFAEPGWLWLAILGPIALIVLHAHAGRARKRQILQFAGEKFAPDLTRSHSPARRMLKNACLVLAMAGMGVAMARPQWGEKSLDVTQLLGEDVIFAVDCSRSMLATDVSPNRLERAKFAVREFLRRQTRGRLGLVAFAGQAFLQCPLTYDYGAFEDALTVLDDKTIPVPGTDIGRALDETFRAMDKAKKRKIVILITDGEDLEQEGVRVAQDLAKQGLVVFTIGVGTPAGSEIHYVNDHGQQDLVRDAKGQIVHSRLDETTLRAIAEATHGAFHPLGPLGEGLALVQTALETMSAEPDATVERKFGVDRFHLPVAIALALLAGESLMSTRRRAAERTI